MRHDYDTWMERIALWVLLLSWLAIAAVIVVLLLQEDSNAAEPVQPPSPSHYIWEYNMTVVAYTGEQLNQVAEIQQMLSDLSGLVEDLKQKSEQYPFTKEQMALRALEAKVAADRVYKFALAA